MRSSVCLRCVYSVRSSTVQRGRCNSILAIRFHHIHSQPIRVSMLIREQSRVCINRAVSKVAATAPRGGNEASEPGMKKDIPRSSDFDRRSKQATRHDSIAAQRTSRSHRSKSVQDRLLRPLPRGATAARLRVLQLCGCQCVAEQHSDRQRSDPSRHRCDR